MKNGEPFVPVWLDDCGLDPVAFRVLCHLWRRRNHRTGQCNPAAEGIAKICGINRDTVWRALRTLKEAGLVSRKKRGFGSSNSYFLTVPNTEPSSLVESPPNRRKHTVVEDAPIGGNLPYQTAENSDANRPSISVSKVLNGRYSKERESASAPAPSRSCPKDLGEWLEYAKSIGWPLQDAKTAYYHYETNGWVQGKNTPIRNWQAAAQTCKLRNTGTGSQPPASSTWGTPQNRRSRTAEPQARVAEPLSS